MSDRTGTLNRLFSLDGKVALVTGGSRGIGRMIAEGFVAAGVRTYVSARNAGDCEAAAAEMSASGTCIALPADVSTMVEIESLAARLTEREGWLDILVNNAGVTWSAPFEDYPEDRWDAVLDINLKAPFFLVQRLLPLLRASAGQEDPARVVNLASVNGLTNSHAKNFAYTASKAGLVHLTRHLSSELAADWITVNAIAPGYFPTEMTARMDDARWRSVKAATPIDRFGTPEDAAGVAIFLCSRASAWMTGAVLALDGGLSAGA